MKYSILTILILTSLNVWGQNNIAKELVNTIYAKEVIDGGTENTIQYFKEIDRKNREQYGGKSLPDDVYDYMKTIIKTVLQRMINEDLVEIYNKTYSSKEIVELNTFYQSDIGKKYLEKSPVISKEMQDLMINKYYPVMMEEIKAYIENRK